MYNILIFSGETGKQTNILICSYLFELLCDYVFSTKVVLAHNHISFWQNPTHFPTYNIAPLSFFYQFFSLLILLLYIVHIKTNC